MKKRRTHGMIGEYNQMRRNSSWRRGFSLIELLMVIVIISILASLLFPTLRRARMISLSASCMNNIKQDLLATYSYGGDFNDIILTRTNNASGYGYKTWLQLLDLGGYVNDYTVTLCPSAAPNVWNPNDGERVNKIYASRRTISFSASYDPGKALVEASDSAGNVGAFDVLILHKVQNASEFAYFMDSWNATRKIQFFTITAAASDNTGVGMHHINTANIGFMDGHVEGVSRERMMFYGIFSYFLYGNEVAF